LNLQGKYAFLLLLLITGANLTAAQQAAQPAGEPAANPGRPTVSTPATLTPVGYLQFENGGMNARQSPEFSTQLNFNETIKLAVTSRLQLLAVTEPVARSEVAGKHGTEPCGYALGGQAVLRSGQGTSPTVAASYLRQVYGGAAADLDLGSANDSVVFLASADLWEFHYDTNAMFNRMKQNGVSRPQFGQTLSVSHPLSKQFSLTGELWHFTQPFLHGRAVGNLWSLGYTPRANLVWDAGFQRGLTGTSTQWEAIVGFTYLLPHRFWR
jgi:uncharacterized membrane protein